MKLYQFHRAARARALLVVLLGAASGFALADDPAPASTTPSPAATEAPPPAVPAPAPVAADGAAPLYRVVDGNNVDANTFAGWKTWRSMACERCHGPNQEGLVGPSLVKDLKVLTKQQFMDCVLKGRVEKGMPNFGAVKTVTDNIDNLYAFLKGRSDGAIATGHLHKLPD
jgi:mono/diheme cytochrome c family protein